MAERRRPYHVIVFCGLSASLYAFTLMAVARSQVEEDKQTIVEREPIVSAVELLADYHTAMGSTLSSLRERYENASDRYAGLIARVNDIHGLVADLGLDVARLDEVSAKVPSDVRLPGVPRIAPARNQITAAPPPTHGNTGASGKP